MQQRMLTISPQNVLIIGAGTSSADIAKELGPVAKTIYQSSRGGHFDFPATFLPANGIRIGELASFDSIMTEGSQEQEMSLDDRKPIPGTVTLKSGERICDIDYIIVATGYHITLPFLSSYHSDSTPAVDADEKVLVTDGTQLHNLHKDIFYIPDPTLLFIGVPYFTATFTLFEFQAIVAATVLSGLADLPPEEMMRTEYKKRVQTKGYGKLFHSLRGVEVEYVNELLEWINPSVKERGGKAVDGHSQTWHEARAILSERMKKMFEGDGKVKKDGVLVSVCG
jgi:ACS family pantothenate transporter-like MFS transporter